MSIEHKGYLFRYDEFEYELAGLLHRALETEDVDSLRKFINRHRSSLTDQWTEEPLEEDWEEHLEPAVQGYANLALTKYYDCADDLGFSYGFDALVAYLRTISEFTGHADTLIVGRVFGPKGKRLDPGCMGTGLVSPAETIRFAQLLSSAQWPAIPRPESEIYAECYYQPESDEDVQELLDQLIELYRRAVQAKAGLLLVDFNERGVSDL